MSEQIARQFHDTYERLASQFGYETREDTRVFDPQSQNGRLMIAVCGEVIGKLERERNRYKSDVEVITKERDEARNMARWLDDHEAIEALLFEMQGLRDELVDVKRERDQWRIQCEQAEMALQNIATGSNCRECGGEDQARIAKDVIRRQIYNNI